MHFFLVWVFGHREEFLSGFDVHCCFSFPQHRGCGTHPWNPRGLSLSLGKNMILGRNCNRCLQDSCQWKGFTKKCPTLPLDIVISMIQEWPSLNKKGSEPQEMRTQWGRLRSHVSKQSLGLVFQKLSSPAQININKRVHTLLKNNSAVVLRERALCFKSWAVASLRR